MGKRAFQNKISEEEKEGAQFRNGIFATSHVVLLRKLWWEKRGRQAGTKLVGM